MSLYQLLGADKSKAAGIKSAYSDSDGLILQPEHLNQLFKEFLPPLWFAEDNSNGSNNSFRNFILIAKGTNFEALESLSKTLPNADYFNTVESAKKSLTDQRVSARQIMQFDIGDREKTRELLEADVEANGAFYGVVCNAGIADDAAFPAMESEQWDSVIHTNLDVSGLVGNRGQVNYSAAKAGIIGASKSLAIELAKRKITVNAVAPGVIETDMTEDLFKEEMYVKEAKKMIPMGTFGQPELIVGESNLPAVVPIFRRLGIEEKVARISKIKRGASFRHGNGLRMDIPFQTPGKRFPNFSYNTPRPQLDSLVRQRAEEVGVRFVNKKATLELTPDNPDRDLMLSEASLIDAGLDKEKHPDILVDASGRSRQFSRLLDIPAKRGGRDDVAYFAHFEGFDYQEVIEGQIVVSILENGWSWQIPLKGKLSVGVVVNKQAVKEYGDTPEERLDAIIEQNSILRNDRKNAKRVSNVMRYQNYQLLSEKGYGKGWVLLGDAFGFVDPMLSPGVFMALKAAETIDEVVFSSPARLALQIWKSIPNK
ncbi:3-oxoacyl-[acyl-carrier-protein] reductase FabG [Nymphon striatum]|nr:3-oxoacyl-[acyl-carrier-protein] reductase FabG [Nymphon striatum]